MGTNPKHDFPPELDTLLHPCQAFVTPQEVVDDPDLTINEKRAILASWASDASAVEAMPALRRVPGAGVTVSIDEILEALRDLDRIAQASGADLIRRRARRGALEARRKGSPAGELSG